MRCLRGFARGLAAGLLIGVAGHAQEAARHVFPVAAARGQKIAVTISGKFDPWPQAVWVDAPGVTFSPGEKPGKYEVTVAEDAAPGPRLIRPHHAKGVAAPGFFLVTETPDTLEAEPNDAAARPQAIEKLPAVVNGKLDKAGDVDSYAVTLASGQTLVARMDAYVLASTFDGLLRITDESGHVLAFNHDGRTLDPLLAWTAPRAGKFIVQVMGFVYPATAGVGLVGGEGCIYRLHLTSGPFVRATLPLAIPRGRQTLAQLIGWNLPSGAVELDGTDAGWGRAKLPAGWGAELPPELSELDERVEANGGNAALAVGSAVSGRLGAAGEIDRYTFPATKGQSYEFRVLAARAGSELDAWVKIESPEGKELARSDDADGSRDPRLTWKATADGNFTVALGDLTQQGGPLYFYRLALVEPSPSVAATLAAHFLNVAPGKSAEVKVAVKRANGFKPELVLAAKELPAGVTAEDVPVPAKDGEVTLKVAASAEAGPFDGPVRVVLREKESGTEHRVIFPLTTTGENNGVPQGYTSLVVESTDQLWLIVPPAS